MDRFRDARAALAKLVAGNQRFVEGHPQISNQITAVQRAVATQGQNPTAVVVGCSDSRVPVELIFDQGLGDLFVVRTAGHVLGTAEIGSVEFAADRLGTRLVVVLGHSLCGAVGATLDALVDHDPRTSTHLLAIIDKIRPAVSPLVPNGKVFDRRETMRAAVQANVLSAVDQLRRGSPLITGLNADGLLVVGAKYNLDSGAVELLDDGITRHEQLIPR